LKERRSIFDILDQSIDWMAFVCYGHFWKIKIHLYKQLLLGRYRLVSKTLKSVDSDQINIVDWMFFFSFSR